jgi:hypothetical protein
MSNRYAQVVVLAEDLRSANLLRRYAQRALDIDQRKIRQEISPSGQGDAKQWVIGRYPLEVRELRTVHRRTGLLVHLDADVDSVAQRSKQLADALNAAGQAERTPAERITHAIPRRHTETWLCTLTGIDVDEDMDCKRNRLPPNPGEAVKPAALALYELTRNNAPPPRLPSLVVAVPELRRLET